MKKISIFILLILALAALNIQAATVAVYHTSDVHGWYSARPAAWDNENPTRLAGGFAALAALLKKETTPYLLLDSGDMFQGTPEGILTRGLSSMALMNQLGYNAAVPGNHDYDFGADNLRSLIGSANFPLLAANIYNKAGGDKPDYVKPYAVFERAGRRIAVLGLAGKHTATSTRPENVKHLDFRDETAEAARWLPVVKEQAPDAVIVLTHWGIDEAISLKRLDISTWTFTPAPVGTLNIIRAVPGIDLLLGGHDHTALHKGYKDPVSGTWIGESGYGLSHVTRAELTFDDKTGKLTDVSVAALPLWIDRTGEDPAVLATVAGFNASVEIKMGRVVGEAADDLTFAADGLDSVIGNWLCDITRKATGSDLAFHNTKAIRTPIKRGTVLVRDLYQTMPFDNDVITMRLNGAQLRQLIADNIVDNMSFIQVSGLEVKFKPGADRKADHIVLTRNGKAIKPEEEFAVATNDYLAYGGNGGDAFQGGKDIVDTMIPVRSLMEQAFARGKVKAPRTGRIKRIK
ncbi:MAG: bifunctional UDP-sugar hydrolase/5'-nucleotidase [Elusimicrobiales bacterium]